MKGDVTPQVGDIWACRTYDRRARVVRVFPNGDVRLVTVALIGNQWVNKLGGHASTCTAVTFATSYRLLVRAA